LKRPADLGPYFHAYVQVVIVSIVRNPRPYFLSMLLPNNAFVVYVEPRKRVW